MSDQTMTITVRQRHSGARVSITCSWTSDDYVVHRSTTHVKDSDARSIDSWLYESLRRAVRGAGKVWEAQTTLF